MAQRGANRTWEDDGHPPLSRQPSFWTTKDSDDWPPVGFLPPLVKITPPNSPPLTSRPSNWSKTSVLKKELGDTIARWDELVAAQSQRILDLEESTQQLQDEVVTQMRGIHQLPSHFDLQKFAED